MSSSLLVIFVISIRAIRNSMASMTTFSVLPPIGCRWQRCCLLFLSCCLLSSRHRAIENANIVKQRAGKANKVAVKRLKKAAKLMKAGKDSDFYDEVLRALWGYIGDKLNMPVDQLTRDNVRDQLQAYNVTDETINQFIGALDECEFARYAPGDATGNMNKVYDAAISAITQIANTMKKSKNVSPHAVILLLLLMLPLVSTAATKPTQTASMLLNTISRPPSATSQC